MIQMTVTMVDSTNVHDLYT